MFDLDPYLLRDLVKEINHDRIGVGLDIARANISKVEIKEWFNVLRPYIKQIHINDNDGNIESHMELGKGNINYKEIYPLIKELKNNPTKLIEISDLNKIKNSFEYILKNNLDTFN
jgi:sugar phosphate isomerase/epimerase